MKKLVILRGNSGSGKTTVARALQRKIGFNTMLRKCTKHSYDGWIYFLL